MRDIGKWVKQHRNGRLRAYAIIDRQERKPDVATPKCKRWKTDREDARRRRQIEAGQLEVSV